MKKYMLILLCTILSHFAVGAEDFAIKSEFYVDKTSADFNYFEWMDNSFLPLRSNINQLRNASYFQSESCGQDEYLYPLSRFLGETCCLVVRATKNGRLNGEPLSVSQRKELKEIIWNSIQTRMNDLDADVKNIIYMSQCEGNY